MNSHQDSVSDAARTGGVANRQWVLRAMTTGKEFALHGDMLVGREAECQIPVMSGHISRYHAKIRVTTAGVILEDLNSTNGTYVNGIRLTAPKMLSMGDEIVFHTERFRLVSGRSGDAEATMIMAAPASLAPRRDTPRLQPVSEPAANEAVPAPAARPFPASEAGFTPDSFSRPRADSFARVNVPDDSNSTRILSGAELALKADRARLSFNISTPRVPGDGPRLVVMTAPLRGKIFPIADQPLGTTWRIGRGESCELRVNDGTVSQDHARIVRGAEGWQIAVTNARNALVVNGEVETSHALTHGDRLLLGRMEIVFATDVDVVIPVLLPPPEPVYTKPWFIGAVVCTGLVILGGLGTLLLG